MASLGSVFVDVLADTSGFEDSLSEGLSSAIKRTAIGSALGSTIALGVGKAIKEFLPLEQRINEIFQVQGVQASDAMFNALADQIYTVAGEIAKPAESVGAAIALGIGRGFDQTASVELAKISGGLAIALGSDLEPAVKGVTAALNGFGLGVDDAGRVAGVLYQTVAKAGVPLEQFAQQIGNIAPAASTAGIGLEDVTAAIATMVQEGISAAESTTQIRTAITELSREASDGGKVFKSISGKTFPEFIKQGGTLQDAFRLIAAASDKSGYSVQELTGNYNTANAVIALTGENTARYTQNLADNKKGVDALASATKTAESGALFQFNAAINKINTGVQQVGGAFRPLIDILVAKLTPAVDWIAGALAKLASIVSEIDFTALGEAIDSMISRLQPFGDLIVAIYNVLSALNWNQVFGALIAAAYPAAALIGVLAQVAGALAKVIEFLTPVLRAMVDVISYLIIPLIAFHSITKIVATGMLIWKAAIVGVKVAMFLLGPAIQAVTYAVRGLAIAMQFLQNANIYVRVLVIAITALVAAFIYAWRNSEKFREIVVKSFNAIKNGALTGIKFIVDALAGWYKFALNGFKSLLSGLGHLPDWLGGGKFDNAAAGVQRLINGIDSIQNSLDGLIDKAKEANWVLNETLTSGAQDIVDAAKGLQGGQFHPTGGVKKSITPKLPKVDTSGLGDLLGDDSKKAAADAAKKIKASLADLWDDIRKFAKDIGEKSIDQIKSGFDGLYEKFNSLIAEAASAGNAAVVKRLRVALAQVKAFDKQLTKLAGKRDVLDEKLKTATENLKQLKDASLQFATSTKAAFVNIGSVAEASAGIGVTFLGIRNNLRDAIRTTTTFNTAIKKLQALGLNDSSLRQLADAGPAALDQAMALARSGQNGINEVNKLQAELDKIAGKTASNLNKEFYSAGIAAADGLVKGLTSQRAKIVAEMEKIAAAMTAATKKSLKIASPSKVFEDLGAQVPAGMAVGVRRGTPDVLSAIQALASQKGSATVDMGGIQINGVSDPAAARRAGILAGEAIAATLQKRKTAQILSGVA